MTSDKRMMDQKMCLQGLDRLLSAADFSRPARVLQQLIAAGLDQLPQPASGYTLHRWQALARVASYDLGLSKLYEGHADALAILGELSGRQTPEGSCWGVWCAEPPGTKLRITSVDSAAPDSVGGQGVLVDGAKFWCSGAADVSHALISAWNTDDKQCLVAVEMNQPGIAVTAEGWQAVGMRTSASVNVSFHHVVAVQVGEPGSYIERPGFWHGGAGIAACWYGAMEGIAMSVRRSNERNNNPHSLAHLGAIDVILDQCAQVLRSTAQYIDEHPNDDAQFQTGRARLGVEAGAEEILWRASRALGAGPLCQNGSLARLMADLPIFIRQSHAERDQAAHGAAVTKMPPHLWNL